MRIMVIITAIIRALMIGIHFNNVNVHGYTFKPASSEVIKSLFRMIKYPVWPIQQGLFLNFTKTGDVKNKELRKNLSIFPDCELIDLLVVMEDNCMIRELEQLKIKNFSRMNQDDFPKLIAELIKETEFDKFQCIAEEAAEKGMFLPHNSKFEETSYLCNHMGDMYLVIGTIKIPSKVLEESRIHRRQDNNVFLKVTSSQQAKRDLPENSIYFEPRKKDTSLEFRGFLSDSLDNNYYDGGNSTFIKVPMVITDSLMFVRMIMDEYDIDCCSDYFEYFLPVKNLMEEGHGAQQQKNVEGVAIGDDIIPLDLHKKLIKQIDDLASSQIVPDYHPHSNGTVRDLIHPALYSYVKGVSPVTKSTKEVSPCSWDDDEDYTMSSAPTLEGDDRNVFSDRKDRDYWGRLYEESLQYQWLPTYFDIGSDGSCKINDYINNLVPRAGYTHLYSSLEELFSYALPLLESVYSYGRHIRKHMMDDSVYEDETKESVVDPYEYCSDMTSDHPIYNKYGFQDGKSYSLRGKTLQVITKIVDYELDCDTSSYEGVWHVEGMSHEEIVATAMYVVERDDDIIGGDLLFKRAIHKNEAGFMCKAADQNRPLFAHYFIRNGTVPLGKVETKQKRMIVFPNSHIHKVSTLEIEKLDEVCSDKEKTKKRTSKSRRRIIVFFLVNPKKRIISTREVPPQQMHAGGNMTLKEALDHRLNLMKERKYTKQDFNIRPVELCEH